MKYIFWIFLYIVCVTFAQVLLKIAMTRDMSFNESINFSFFYNALSNLKVISGLILYGLSFLIWLIVLNRVEITFAYPLLSLSVIFVAIISWVFIGETFNYYRLIGMILTILGCWLVIKS
jgi:drug/metabolite transporter (DMT)-like permease